MSWPRVVFPAIAGIGFLLGGCFTVGPDYARPGRADLPPDYVGAAPDFVQPAASADRQDWWTYFGDPVLDHLVALGLANNPDVRTAESRLREARALLRGARAGRRPSLAADGEIGAELEEPVSGEAEDADDPAIGGSAAAGVGFDWVLDLFGGVEREIEAAQANARVLEALRRDAALAVVAEIARTYVGLRGAQARLALTDASLDLQRRTLEIVRGRVDSGLASDFDLARGSAELAALQADRAPIVTEIRRASAALAVLVGQPPGTLSQATTGPDQLPTIEKGPDYGLPADLIRQRPDIAAAEQDLIRATAEIGVAEAALYPRFTLPGRIGIDTVDLATGSMATSVVGSLFLAIDAPLFDGGRRRAELEASHERAEQALLAYHATLLTALREVEDALEGYAGAQRRVVALERAVAANSNAFEQAEDLYREGLANFIEVLDAQRALNELRQDLALARIDQGLEVISLYEAAGLAPDLPALRIRDR